MQIREAVNGKQGLPTKTVLYHGDGSSPETPLPHLRQHWRVALMLLAVALLVRLVFLPHATLDANDAAVRIWLGWRWADEPFFITNGLWGPLHFYLIGAVMRLWPDPVWAPMALHVAIGAMVPIAVYRLTFELFGSHRSAITAGLIFAFYPAAIDVSLGARVETPFLLSFGIGLVALVRAWRPDGQIRHAVVAGLAITVAAMLRYEAWILLPFLTLLLIRHPRRAAAFLATAMIHPVIWMIGNYLEFGNPLFSLTATSSWVEDETAHAPETALIPGLVRVARLVARTGAELTLPVALLVSAGVIETLRTRRAESAWLVLPTALFVVFAFFTYRSSMPAKLSYSTTFGLLLIPFVAAALERLGIERWSRARCMAGAGALLVAMCVFMSGPLIERLPGGSSISATAVPTMADEASVRRLQGLLKEAGLTPGTDALISDNFGSRSTVYVALQTRLHPESICRDPTVASWHVPSDEIRSFLSKNRSGVLITHSSGRISAHLTRESEYSGTMSGIPLRLSPIGSALWNSDHSDRQYGSVSVIRYQVAGMPEPAPAGPECSRNCPLTLCRHPASLYE
jgi:hypothetical protein